MGGIYGDQLAAFPELMQNHIVFSMKAKVGGGYGARFNKRPVVGYLSRWKGGKAEIQGDLFTENERATFWVWDSTSKGLFRQGDFVEDNDQLFKFVHDDEYMREGGFAVYDLQLVAGLTDRQNTNTKVDAAIRNDY